MEAGSSTERAGQPGNLDAPVAQPEESLRKWRELLSRVIATVLLVLAALIGGLQVWAHIHGREAPLVEFYLPALGVLVLVAALGKRLTFQWRTGLTIGAGLLMVVSSTFTLGFSTPNQFVGMLMLFVLSALMLESRLTWALFACCCASTVGAAGYFVATAQPVASMSDGSLVENWVRVVVTFVAISGCTLWAVLFVTGHLRQSLVKTDELLTALRSETQQRLDQLAKEQQLEDELRRAQRLEALGRLSGGVAHDFNNLLVVVMSGVEAVMQSVQEGKDTAGSMSFDENLETLDAVMEAARGGAELTHELLAFGGQSQGERHALDLNAAVTRAFRLLKRLLPNSIRCQLTLEEGVGAIAATTGELDQLLMNLALNARDAMPDGGTLSVETSRALSSGADGVCLTVTDTGVGMEAGVKERLFEPFFTTKSVGKGTGLGLSVVHGMVRRLEGSIEVQSEPGRGTEVRIQLPASGVASVPSLLSVPDGGARGNGETILLVEDAPLVRRMVARVLHRSGYQVICAEDGQEAMILLQSGQKRIDLVISDSVMPRVSGVLLFENVMGIRSADQPPPVPFILCSGYPEGDGDFLKLRGPGRAFLSKPFEPNLLRREVRRLLDEAQQGTPDRVNSTSQLA